MKYVLKVKRRGIERRLNESIDNMNSLLHILSFAMHLWVRIDVTDVVVRHFNLLRTQMDFKQEVANIIVAGNNMSNVDYIRVPHVYTGACMCHGNAIIMEKLPGVHMSEVPTEDKNTFSDLAIKYFFVSSVIHHKFHGDLHAGNVLFIDNGDNEYSDDDEPRFQLGIIDFGIVVHFPENITETLFYIFEHQKDPEMTKCITCSYLNNFLHPPNLLDRLPVAIVTLIVDDAADIARSVFLEGEMLEQVHFYRIFQCLCNNLSPEIISRMEIKTSDGFIRFEVALSMCISLVSHLTDGDPNTQMKRVFDNMFHSDIMFSSHDEDDKSTLSDSSINSTISEDSIGDDTSESDSSLPPLLPVYPDESL